MNPIFFYPPNPSDAEMCLRLLPKFRARRDDFAPVFIDPDAGSKPPGEAIVVGYSWGAYKAMKDLIASAQSPPTHVILIAPHLEAADPLNSLLFSLLNTRVPGELLFRHGAERIRAKFFNKNFPLTQGQHLDPWLLDWFGKAATWREAIRRRYEQQRNPLASSNPTRPLRCQITVIHFSEDRVATPPERVRKLLGDWFDTKIHFLTWAGFEHGSLWSQTARLAGKLEELIHPTHRIGYAPGENIQNNVISFMERHAHEEPEKIAMKWAQPEALALWDQSASTGVAHDQLTYNALNLRVRRLAYGLKRLGIEKGDRVIVFLPMSVDLYTAMFAVQRLGAIAVFLDSWARSHHLGACAACTQPKAMVSSESAFELIAQIPQFKSMPIQIVWGPCHSDTRARFDPLLQTDQEAPIEPVASEHTALITFTTGSSGTPKGANRTHRFLSAQHEALDRILPYLVDDRDLPAFPIFSLNNLAAGTTTILPALDLAAPSDHDAALLVSQLLSEQVTCSTLSPSMFSSLAKYCTQQQLCLPRLRRVVTGGAPISKDEVRAFFAIAPQAAIWILYGSTEAEPIAHIEGRQLLKTDQRARDPELLEEGVCVGNISGDLTFKFLKIDVNPIDLDGKPWESLEVARGKVGELVVAGDYVCRDYYNDDEAFRRAKIKDAQGRIWHRTGDLGYLDQDNLLWLVGRVHNVIERRDRCLFPVRAETLLKRIGGVRQAAFIGLPDEALNEKTVAVVTVAKEADRRQLKQEILRIFAINDIPLDEILESEEIPTDPRHHSKVEYAQLKEHLGKARPL